MKNMIREECLNILNFEKIEMDVASGKHSYRAPVPGGWILRFVNTSVQPQDVDYLFLVDAKHAWETQDKEEKMQ